MSESKKTEPKKQSWIERLASKVGFVRPTENKKQYEIASLADGSVQLYQDRKLSERIDGIEVLIYAMTKPLPNDLQLKEKIKLLRERLETFNQLIQTIAAPYARGGDNPKYSKLMHGWNGMYGVASSWIIMTETYFIDNETKPDDETTQIGHQPKILSDNTVVVNDLHKALVQHIFPDAYDVLAYCFKDADVRPMAVTVIQSMMPLAGMGQQMDVNRNTENM